MLLPEVLGLLGLARRAAKVVIGATAVRHEIRRQRAMLLIFATDFSPATKARLLAEAHYSPPVFDFGTMQEWGAFFSRSAKTKIGVIAITDKNFAAGILQKLTIPA
jgi:ribosomal protein L7Ae-like RNA K-turn-binding protein